MPEKIRLGTAFYIDCFGLIAEKCLLILTSRAEVEENLQLVVAGGHKRGAVLLVLPKEAYSSEYSISRNWLIDQWSIWVDAHSSADDVVVVSDLLTLLSTSIVQQ